MATLKIGQKVVSNEKATKYGFVKGCKAVIKHIGINFVVSGTEWGTGLRVPRSIFGEIFDDGAEPEAIPASNPYVKHVLAPGVCFFSFKLRDHVAVFHALRLGGLWEVWCNVGEHDVPLLFRAKYVDDRVADGRWVVVESSLKKTAQFETLPNRPKNMYPQFETAAMLHAIADIHERTERLEAMVFPMSMSGLTQYDSAEGFRVPVLYPTTRSGSSSTSFSASNLTRHQKECPIDFSESETRFKVGDAVRRKDTGQADLTIPPGLLGTVVDISEKHVTVKWTRARRENVKYQIGSARDFLEIVAAHVEGDFTIRELQTSLPWTIRYSTDFRSSPVTHKDFAHALHHVGKAAGQLHAMVDDMDHDRTVADSGDLRQRYGKYIADLVICALRMSNTMPGGVLDLEDAVVSRLRDKNKPNPEVM